MAASIILGAVSSANIELVRRFNDFYEAGDMDSVMDLFAEDAEGQRLPGLEPLPAQARAQLEGTLDNRFSGRQATSSPSDARVSRPGRRSAGCGRAK
jgi:ketosteroid isomerase-like protein